MTKTDLLGLVEELRANSIQPVDGFYVLSGCGWLEPDPRRLWELDDYARRRRAPLWWRGEKKRRRRAARAELRTRPLPQDETPPVG